MEDKIRISVIFVAALICLGAVFVGGSHVGYHYALKGLKTGAKTKVDTLVLHDTITRTEAKVITMRVIERVPVPVEIHDTTDRVDTVYLEREQVEWRDDYCTVYASGILPAVDSVQHYITEKIITKETTVTKTKKARWGVGLQVGVGAQYGIVSRKADIGPYVGVGVTYNLGSW